MTQSKPAFDEGNITALMMDFQENGFNKEASVYMAFAIAHCATDSAFAREFGQIAVENLTRVIAQSI